MKRILTAVAMAAGLFVLGAGAYAQGGNTPGIDRREVRQQKRIVRGVESGRLTTREAIRLEAQQGRVHAMEARAKADGTVTAKERVRIQRAQNRTSRNIYRQKHDAQRR